MSPNPLSWECPLRDGGSQGGDNVVNSLFGGKKSLRTDIFMREDMQNHVDAKDPDFAGPVLVRLSFKTLSAELISRYFDERFQEHFIDSELRRLDGRRREDRAREIREVFSSREFPVLVIEDFNTIGLNGPVNTKVADRRQGSPYYHPDNALTCFFQRSGESGKTGKQLGSAGLGRHVYYMASRISAKLIYTVPKDSCRKADGGLQPIDPRPLFFGQSCQNERQRITAAAEECYENYLSLTPGKGPNGGLLDPYLPFGLNDDESGIVDRVRQDFELVRRPDQRGLSIVIPFPRENLTHDSLLKAVVRYFAIPVIDGRLEVVIDEVKIDANTIIGLTGDAQVDLRNTFLSTAVVGTPEARVEIDAEDLSGHLQRDNFEPSDLQELASRFHAGEMTGVTLVINFGDASDENGEIKVWAQKTITDHRGQLILARGGLEIASVSDTQFSRQWNAYVSIGDDWLGILLRECETPSHDDWIADDILDLCPRARELVRFVKTCGHDFVGMLTSLDQEPDTENWADLFPELTGGRRDGGLPPSTPPQFSIALRSDGQTAIIATTDEYKAGPRAEWGLEILYDTVRGNRRRAFRPGTFDLRNARKRIVGGRVLGATPNTIHVAVDDPSSFRLTVGPCSFAEWPDVHVRVVQS